MVKRSMDARNQGFSSFNASHSMSTHKLDYSEINEKHILYCCIYTFIKSEQQSNLKLSIYLSIYLLSMLSIYYLQN